MNCDWCNRDDNYIITELHLRGKIHPKVKVCVACGRETKLDIGSPEYNPEKTVATTETQADITSSITTNPTQFTTF